MNQPMLTRCANAFAVALVSAVSGCGSSSDHVSEVHTLRVLAVRSESPFAKPGATTQLSMLAFDGSPRAKRADGSMRPTSTLWIGGCTNPAGDSFTACMPYLHEVTAQLGDDNLSQGTVPANAPPGIFGWGQTFEAYLPTDTISSRPIAEGVVNPYGVQMVFFAYCGGALRRIDADASQFPLGCFDVETGEELGRDDFEFGFYPLFSYESVQNQNPVLQSFELVGTESGPACSDSLPCPVAYHCGSENLCVPVMQRCTASDADKCEKHALTVDVPRTSVERDVVAHVAEADAAPETVWVSYYASGGSFDYAAQMISEPNTGWNDNPTGYWRANTDSNREVRLWAVVRDNRNGVAWSWLDVWVN